MVAAARDEARTHGHNYVGTEHLLVGLLLDTDSGAFRILESHEIDATRALAWIAREVGRGDWGATRELRFTPRAKQALEIALQEAAVRGHARVDSEHLLLGLARVDDGLAARIMADLGADPHLIADAVLGALASSAR